MDGHKLPSYSAGSLVPLDRTGNPVVMIGPADGPADWRR